MKKGFDKDFLWGGAIAASQADGAWNVGGKGLDTQDCRYLDGSWSHEQVELKHHNDPFSRKEFEAALKDNTDTYYPFRRGIDFYHHYTEDLAMMAQWAVKEANPLYPVPVIYDEAHFIRILKKAGNL